MKYLKNNSAQTMIALNSSAQSSSSNKQFSIGDVGLNGGIIFYDAGSSQYRGRYIEAMSPDESTIVMPQNICWTKESTNMFLDNALTECNLTKIGTLDSIGSSKSNTEQILSNSYEQKSAALYASNYKTDKNPNAKWYLPSKDELILLLEKIPNYQNFYWSSSEDSNETRAYASGRISDTRRYGFYSRKNYPYNILPISYS